MAIIGNGSIAKLLNDREWFMFFASGISNSTNNTKQDIDRESLLLSQWIRKAINNDWMFVYFSSISIFMSDTHYTRHKIQMESMVRKLCENYTILRLGNVWECTNPNTFINAYKTKPYEPRNEYKFMISKNQLNFVIGNLPSLGKHEISIFGEMLLVKDVLKKAGL